MSETLCSICRHLVMDDDGPIGDIVDKFVYDFDGSLDYIELMHRKCALRKGYKIKNDRVVNEAREQPAEKLSVIDKFDLRYEQSLGSGEKWVDKDRKPYMWYDQMFGDKWKPVGGWVFPLETYRDAQNRYRAQGIGLRESQQTATYSQVNEMLPEPHEEEVRRVAGRFQVVNRKGKPVGDSYPSYSAAQKADQAAQKKHYQESAGPKDMTGIKCTKCKRGTYKETSQTDDMDGVLHCNKCGHEVQRWEESADAVTAISKNECSTTKYFGKVRVEVAPPGKESWVKANKSRFKKEYGAKKGTEVLYATAWKNKKQG